ncbi:MAG: hypothetical protein IKL68_00470 [Clostridia bacterium]|nr:hypothetical protein [Clostridia bacterium]
MRLTDYSMIFIAIFLPIVIIAFVNTSFMIKSEKNEMYYKAIINSATKDAVAAMKQIESEDIDYGYSGIVDKKVSINPKAAITTYYNSLANNFGIKGNENALQRLKMYIPVIAVIDYDGIYIHSLEETTAGKIEFVTKPKIKYTYTYVIAKKEINPITHEKEYDIINAAGDVNLGALEMLSDVIYEITYTMDDYVYLNIYKRSHFDVEAEKKNLVVNKGFYLTDMENNLELVYSEDLSSDQESALREKIVKHLSEMRKDVIARIGMKHISYAINHHNDFSGLTGIDYKFTFTVDSDTSWFETMNGIGIISVIQGISLGNRYLNYKSYSAAELSETRKYYVSAALEADTKEPEPVAGIPVEKEKRYYLEYNLYHASTKCLVYEYYISMAKDTVVPIYYQSKAAAATQGYYACPICKP